jgi:DNA-binding NarL/FixJ family response regulator
MRLLRLTPRERAALARAAAGETNTAIAQAMFVSPGTVRKHLEHVYDKLGVRTRTEAATIYTQERVVIVYGVLYIHPALREVIREALLEP